MQHRGTVAAVFIGVVTTRASLFAGSPGYANKTAEAQINATQQTLSGVPFWLAGGGVVGDFNRDGWQDFYFCAGGGSPDGLWINNQDGTFTD